MLECKIDRRGQRTHDLRGSGNFIHRFALERQRNQKTADLSVSGLAGHDLLHDLCHIRLSQVLACH